MPIPWEVKTSGASAAQSTNIDQDHKRQFMFPLRSETASSAEFSCS